MSEFQTGSETQGNNLKELPIATGIKNDNMLNYYECNLCNKNPNIRMEFI
ncbi:MAG: hypothetical protein MJ252_16150 [archaeon]|nr:hypothetical protein [archaeon]